MRCRVQEHNRDFLMEALLVYHETHQFVRLVQIMPLQVRPPPISYNPIC